MIEVSVNTSTFGIDRLTARLEAELSKAVRGTAFFIEGEAKQNAPVDTGALKNSIYSVTSLGNNFEGAWNAAKEAFNTQNKGEAPVAQLVARPGPLEAFVVVGVNYGRYVEYGTSRMPAQPFMQPAAMVGHMEFLKAVKAAIIRARI